MARVVKTVPIELDKKRNLLYTMEAFSEFMDATGINLLQQNLTEEMFANPKTMSAFIWAGLLHEDETLTIKQVARMLTPDDIRALWKTCVDVFEQQFPERKEEGEGDEATKNIDRSTG